MHRITALIVVFVLVIGCGRRRPLDDSTLDILTRTGMHGADITYPDGYKVSLPPDSYDMMRSLIAALGPIKSANEGNLEDFDYRLVYIAGMDPAVIDVKLVDDTQFKYQWNEYVYTGGDPGRFQNRVDAIRKHVEAIRDDRSKNDESGEPSDAPESR